MSTQPPMPPTPPGPPGGFQPPPGYQPYGAGGPAPTTNSGMAIASMVLSLVGIIPCFWGLQIPGLLGTIFGFIGMGQTKDGSRKGRGMAIAGLVIGIILLVICALVWIYITTSDDCTWENNQLRCVTN